MARIYKCDEAFMEWLTLTGDSPVLDLFGSSFLSLCRRSLDTNPEPKTGK
jgi:hypothetical protein